MPSFFSSVTICKVNANWHEVCLIDYFFIDHGNKIMIFLGT